MSVLIRSGGAGIGGQFEVRPYAGLRVLEKSAITSRRPTDRGGWSGPSAAGHEGPTDVPRERANSANWQVDSLGDAPR
jgi:hypothetical protein